MSNPSEIHEANCLGCGKEFTTENIRKRFCSLKCYRSKWREENRGKTREYAIKHRWKNVESYRAYAIEYNKTHPEAHRAASRKYRELNIEPEREKTRKHRMKKSGVSIVSLTLQDWENIKAAYNNCCAYCGIKSDNLSQDHVIPISKGGQHIKENVVPCCRPCNSKKRDKSLAEFGKNIQLKIL
jgi:5-methylcytosine-specific restriction endonuclease McrA